jgi:hypothetical protein
MPGFCVDIWLNHDSQNMNTINVMQKKSHQFVFINPYSNAQERCGYLYIIHASSGTKKELT